jgi:hypothetical protein
VTAHAARAFAEFVRKQKQCDTKIQVVYHILLFCRGAEQRSSSRNIPNVFRVFFRFNQNLPGPLFARKSKQLSTSSRHHLPVYFFLGAACPIVSAASPATRTQTAGKLYLLGRALLSSLGLGGLLGSLGLGDLGGGSLCRARGSGLRGGGSLGGGLCGGGSLGGSFCGGAFGGRPKMLVNMRLRSIFLGTYFLTALAILDLRTGRCCAQRALK